MSVQVVNTNPQLVSAAPIIVCPGNKLLLFKTSGQISFNHPVNSGYSGPSTTLWSYIWNEPVQNATVGVQQLVRNC
jgi:hypothetical protein